MCRISKLVISFLLVILCRLNVSGQAGITAENYIDTAGLVVRICRGDIPGQPYEPGKCYYKQVCAYRIADGDTIIYKVDGFELAYVSTNGDSVVSAPSKDNLFTPVMLMILNREFDERGHLWLNNVSLTAPNGDKLFVAGRRVFSKYLK